MSENMDEILDEVIEVEAVAEVEGSKMSDQELDEIVGGANNYGFKIDYYLNYYCPYHRRSHAGIIKCKGGFRSKTGGFFPAYYCPQAGQYYLEGVNGYYDPKGRILVKKR